MTQPLRPTRRALLAAALTLPAAALAACAPPTVAPSTAAPSLDPTPAPTAEAAEATATAAPEVVATQPAALAATPSCGDDDDEPTLAQTEGPYFTPNSPERASLLEAGLDGPVISLTGYVLTPDCAPVPGALLDFWHADAQGVYDNEGYRCRGHQFADDQGRYTLETVVPGLYPGRTRHFHVKVQRPNGPVLTTQLYFPDEPSNARDGIFRPELLMTVAQDAADMQAQFNFVLA
jgi:protocatechuate 3,4-dioxygenase beta subunit